MRQAEKSSLGAAGAGTVSGAPRRGRSRFWRMARGVRILLAAGSAALIKLAFGEAADGLALAAKGQFGPALLAAAGRASLAGAAVAAGWLVLTLFLGRVFCSVGCPLGILQDVLGKLFFWRKNRPQPRLLLLRKGLGVCCWGAALIGGWTLGMRFLEPFTLFGAMVSCGWLPLAALAVLIFWRRRFFCNSLCPVGALLACGASMAPFGFRFTARCIRCGKCVQACPAGCLDPKTAVFDNGRCIRCLACAAVCPVNALAYGRNAACRIPGRRAFLRAGALLAGGAVVGAAARKTVPLYAAYGPRANVAREGIYPPGAGSRQRFLSKCTDCRLCVQHCLGQVLRPAGRFGAVHLEFDRGMCEFNCTRCTEVCPTGALRPLDAAIKKRTRLGLAAVDLTLCVAATEEFECGACAEHCPTGALRMRENAAGVLIPVLDARLCIGCGSCEHPCPVRPIKAVRVWPVEVQVLAADPADLLKPQQPAVQESEEWLI